MSQQATDKGVSQPKSAAAKKMPCPHCRKRFSYDESRTGRGLMAGSYTFCPFCGNQVVFSQGWPSGRTSWVKPWTEVTA